MRNSKPESRTDPLPTHELPPVRSDDVLVIGIGNELRADDGVGPFVASFIRQLNLPGVRVVESAGDAPSLVELFRGNSNVIVIDAFSSNGVPGLLHCLEVTIEQSSARNFGHSTHALGLVEAISLARQLDVLPAKLYVCGIEGASYAPGGPVSDPVRRRLPDLVEEIVTRIEEFRMPESHGRPEAIA